MKHNYPITPENRLHVKISKWEGRVSWSICSVKLTERTDKTGDGSCTDYPNADHESFSACVDHENKLWIMPDLGTIK